MPAVVEIEKCIRQDGTSDIVSDKDMAEWINQSKLNFNVPYAFHKVCF